MRSILNTLVLASSRPLAKKAPLIARLFASLPLS